MQRTHAHGRAARLLCYGAITLLIALSARAGLPAHANLRNTPTTQLSTFTIVPPWVNGEWHSILAGYGPNANSPAHTNYTNGPQDYYALDFGMPLSSPIYPVARGTVLYAGQAGTSFAGYGNIIFIDHGNGYQSLYAHLSQINVTTGSQVTTTSLIGRSGNGGDQQDPHLHFALYQGASLAPVSAGGPYPRNGTAVVPERFTNCTRLQAQPPCENLLTSNKLLKQALLYQAPASSQVGTDCRFPTVLAANNWKWSVVGVPAGYQPALLTDGPSGIWRNTAVYGCPSPYRWMLRADIGPVSPSTSTYTWTIYVAAWPGATPDPSRIYTLTLQNAAGQTLTIIR
jgi:hypothetical protein